MGGASDLNDPHLLAVFVAKELHHVGAVLDFCVGDLAPGDGFCFFDAGVYGGL